MLTSSTFVRKYALPSASSVSSAAKGLLDKGLLTCNRGEYQAMTSSSTSGSATAT